MLKSSSCKYLFVLIWSIGFVWIECEQVVSSASSGAVEGKSSKDIDLLINRLMDETSALQQQQKSTEQKLLHQQRLELLRNVLDAASARSDEDESASVVDGELYDDDDDLASEEELSKRSRPQKKDSQQLRRQAARWDIGFGKRVPHASQTKSKAFMDALYGKRSSGVHYRMPYNARTSYGRRQQWDLQYGRK